MRYRLGVASLAVIVASCASERIPPGEVSRTVQSVLTEAAEPPALQTSDVVQRALLPAITVQMPVAARRAEPVFDLAVKNAAATQVFDALVAGTRFSMLVHPDVRESISLNLKDVTLVQALDAIRRTYGYDYEIVGSRIHIDPLALQTRFFQVNYLAAKRSGRAEIRIGSGGLPAPSPNLVPAAGAPSAATPAGSTPGVLGFESARVTTSSEHDFWKDLQTAVIALVGPGTDKSIVINPNSGVVVVRAMPKEVRAVEQYLRALSLMVERQVMLEAKIIEVTLSDQFSAGVNWAAFRQGDNSRFGAGIVAPGTELRTVGSVVNRNLLIDPGRAVPVSPDPLGTGLAGSIGAVASRISNIAAAPAAIFGLAFQTANFAALLNFLESQGTVHVLSSPRIATLNNQKAVIKVGTDDFFVTNVTTATTVAGAATTVAPTITTQSFFSGISLDVTPQISSDDQVTLHIHPSVSAVVETRSVVELGVLGTFNLPLASSSVNETDTIVRVQNGTIAAIGGLMRQRQNIARAGLPGTTRAAGGVIAGTRDQDLSKSELVVLLKVTVIRGDTAWQQQAQELNDRLDSMRRY